MKYNVTARLFVVAFVFIGSTISLHNLSMTNFGGYSEDGTFNIPPYHEISKTTPKPRITLVHFDPYFLGGFRNQHMRFVAFVAFAVKHNISQILLPSLRWSDHVNKSNSLHHELLFDVPYWNSRAESVGLPLLVNYDAHSLEGIIHTNKGNHTSTIATDPVPCFNETSGLYSGIDESYLRRPGVNLRRVNTYAMIGQGEVYSHCLRTLGENGENNPDKIKEIARQDIIYRFTYLTPHGGLPGGGGRLWREYSALQGNRGKASVPTFVDRLGEEHAMIYPEHVPVEKAIYDLLRPSQHLQKSIANSINRAVQNHTQQKINDHQPRFLALHPRIEQEMLGHRCNKHMESNITKVLEHIRTFTPFHDGNNSNSFRFDSVFMAVSKEGVDKESNKGGEIGQIINHNRLALRRFRKVGLLNGIPLFESGTESASKIQLPMASNNNTSSATRFVSVVDLGVVELVASVINFFTAVTADIFVGVKGSSFSTDVSSVRYYQQKENGGGENYVVGPDGINRRFGPPAPHFC